MHKCVKFILFWDNTLHVSDGLSVHHQEFKTVHTATGICQTDILEWYTTCFGRSFRPSWGVQDCTYSNRHLSNRYFRMILYMFRTVFPSIMRSSRLYIQQ